MEMYRIFSERPFGYKRYIVEWQDGTLQMFSGIWYSLKKSKKFSGGKTIMLLYRKTTRNSLCSILYTGL